MAFKSLSRGNGSFVLTGFKVELMGAGDDKPRPVNIAGVVADFSQKGFPVEEVELVALERRLRTSGDDTPPGLELARHLDLSAPPKS